MKEGHMFFAGLMLLASFILILTDHPGFALLFFISAWVFLAITDDRPEIGIDWRDKEGDR